MHKRDISISGAVVGGLAGFVAEAAIQELTGHHLTHGLLELLGAAAGLWRLDRRLAEVLQDTLDRARREDAADYQQVKRRIQELTRDLPELREILDNLVDAGIQAQKA
jgi:hypothetical protein